MVLEVIVQTQDGFLDLGLWYLFHDTGIFLSVVFAAHPVCYVLWHFPFEVCPTVSAQDRHGEGILLPRWMGNFRAFRLIQRLRPFKYEPVHNRWVTACNVVLILISMVYLLFDRKGISRISFLQQGVTDIFFVLQDIADRCVLPVWDFISCGNS